MKQLLAISILVFIFVGNAYAPDVQKFKVYVHVSTPEEEDKTEKQIIEVTLKRELRALGNVEIVDGDDDWVCRIMINTKGMQYEDGRKIPKISIAYSIQWRVHKSQFKSYDYTNPGIPVFDLTGPGLGFWSKDDLLTLCSLIIEDLDVVLRKLRKYEQSR